MVQGFPAAYRGMVVGLLGGSFDPAHDGHVHITHQALHRIGLDRVWWLVSPGNPLKANAPAPMDLRIARARQKLGDDPRVVVTDLEARLGTRATIDTLRRLKALYPGVRFVWIMGADNLRDFHRWKNWRHIANLVPIVVVSRPGANPKASLSRFAQQFAQQRLPQSAASTLARHKPPVWVYITAPLDPVSSTDLRTQMMQLTTMSPI